MDDRYHPDNVVTLDFETFYSPEKKLGFKHQSTEEYVRDPRWLTWGVGLQRGGNEAHWVPTEKHVATLFESLDLSNRVCVAHNAPFDGFVLKERYGVEPWGWVDTRGMAQMIYGNALPSLSLAQLTKVFLPEEAAKDRTPLYEVEGKRRLSLKDLEELGEYCRGDCRKTFLLYKQFLPKIGDNDEQVEFNLGVMNMVTKMFTSPLLVLDPEPLDEVAAIEATEKQEALDLCVATSMKQLNSNPQFATLLESQGIEAPLKISPNTGKETYAFAKTDRQFMDLRAHEKQEVRRLVRARIRCKTSIMQTRAASYLGVANRGTWPVHLNLSGARTTHRLSGGPEGGGNPQNLTRGSHLRRAITPPPGFRMLAVDSSNIELRAAMVLTRENAVVERLWDESTDLYRTFAAYIYNKEVSEVTKAERMVGKVAMLSLQYGTGFKGFMDFAYSWGIDLSVEEAQRIVDLYRQAFPKVCRTWRTLDYMTRKLEQGQHEQWWNDELIFANPATRAGVPGFTSTRSGLSITYPELRWERDEESGRRQLTYTRYDKKTTRPIPTRLWGSKVFENICQFMAREVVFEQQAQLEKTLQDEMDPLSRVVLSVHDESIVLFPEHLDPVAVLEVAHDVFGTSPTWWPELPVFGEAHIGENYAECK